MSTNRCEHCKYKKEGRSFTYCEALKENYLKYLYNEEGMDHLWLRVLDDTLVLQVTDNFGCRWFEWK